MYISITLRMIKLNPNSVNEYSYLYIVTPRAIIHIDDLITLYNDMCNNISYRLENLLNHVEGSGLIFDSISEFLVTYHKVQIKNLTGFTTP